MNRLLHTADLHIGDRTYGFDRTKSHDLMFEALGICADKNDVELIIMAGDVFDTRNPTTDDLRTFARGLQTIRLYTQAPIVYSPGNHDGSPTIGDPSKVAMWLQTLEVPGLYAFPTPATTVIGPFSLTALPYAHKRSLPPQLEGGMEGVARALENIIGEQAKRLNLVHDMPTIFIGHLSVLGTFLSERQALRMGWDVAVNPEVFRPFSYAALGHIHRRQQVLDNVWYAGQPVPSKFEDEGEDKGWLIASFDGRDLKRVIEVDAPPHLPKYLTFSVEEGGPVDMESFSGNFIRLVFPADAPQMMVEKSRALAIDEGALGVNIVVKPKERPSRARVEVKEDVARKPEEVLGLWLTAHEYDIEPYLSAGRQLMGLLEE